MQPPNQDIYHQDQPPAFARKRRRWLSRNQAPGTRSGPGPMMAASASPTGGEPPPREERHRRRRRSDHSPHMAKASLFTWLGVLLVAAGYLVALIGTQWWAYKHPKPKPAPPPAPVSTPPRPLEASTEPDARPLAERITHWKLAIRLLGDLTSKLEKGPLTDSQAALEKVLAETPDLTRGRLALALILERNKRLPEARNQLLEVLDNEPESGPARLALGRVYLALNEPEPALAMANWIIETDPYSLPAHDLAATALLNLNATADAIVHLKKLVSLNRDDLNLQNNLGMAYLKIGDFRAALQTFNEVLKLDEANSVAHYHLAVTYARQGQATNAVDLLGKSAQRFGASFVTTWTQSTDFDPIRTDPLFQRFLETSAATPAPATNTEAAAEPIVAPPSPAPAP